MAALNPYTVKASEVLDREIHEHIHGESSEGVLHLIPRVIERPSG